MFTLSQVLAATAGQTQLQGEIAFTGITTDSRNVKPGELFVALQGEKFDGHAYCARALAQGAVAVLVSAIAPGYTAKAIVVKDTLWAYQQIAKAYRLAHKNIKVVAITGSNGKTSTKDLIAACLEKKYKVIKTQANFNNEIGLPKTLLSIQEDTEIAVVEMGMRGFGQIKALKDLAQPDIVVITNVGETHMELLGSMANIAKAKSEILENLTANNIAVLNGDDFYIAKMKTAAKTVTYGIIKDNVVQGGNINVTGQGTTFSYVNRINGKNFTVQMPLVGEHNVMNALAAISVAEVLQVPDQTIVEALAHAHLTEKRQEVKRYGTVTAINDAYNASPASMTSALKTLQQLALSKNSGREVAVLADMLELGAISKEAHTKVGQQAAHYGVKLLLTYGQEARYIYEAARGLGVEAYYLNNKEEAAVCLRQHLEEGDTILFKGSHSMEVDRVLELALGK
ncbi:MAG: UDP-N-acetylmuramoyl-tripeptide--D-alanyl-D-alanine ligase [Acidaminococcaceae bacterium]|nr:UDP-N-acetylmuramoyl-tripeptide--D-alanyl-D-alanine ligase [Acidaminococcaceae bacterium]